MRIHAVGRWVRYRCEALPSKASRPCSSSYVPSGRPTWACLATFPLLNGNMSWSPLRRRYLFFEAFLEAPRSCAAFFSRCFFFRSLSCAHCTFARSPLPMKLVLLSALRELLAALARRVDRVQEGRSHPRLFQVPDGGDGRPSRRRHHL